MRKHGVNGTECRFASDGDGAQRRNVTSKPDSFLQGVRFFIDQGWMSSRKTRLVLCGGHIQRVYAATSFLQPLLDPNQGLLGHTMEHHPSF